MLKKKSATVTNIKSSPTNIIQNKEKEIKYKFEYEKSGNSAKNKNNICRYIIWESPKPIHEKFVH